MKHLNLSIKDVKENCLGLYKMITKDNFKPDCILYIKTGGYLVGEELSRLFQVQLVGIGVSRKANNLKKKLIFVLKLMPKPIMRFLKEMEIRSGIHSKNSERHVSGLESLEIQGRNILIVDDSVDTGNSVAAVLDVLMKKYNIGDFDVRIAALNVFESSERVLMTDYNIYKDYIISYPWTKGSEEYDEFLKRYDEASASVGVNTANK